MLAHEADELGRRPVVRQLARLHALLAEHELKHALAHPPPLLRLVHVEVQAAERVHLDGAPGVGPHEQLLDAHLEQPEPEPIPRHEVQPLVARRVELLVRRDHRRQPLRPRRGLAQRVDQLAQARLLVARDPCERVAVEHRNLALRPPSAEVHGARRKASRGGKGEE